MSEVKRYNCSVKACWEAYGEPYYVPTMNVRNEGLYVKFSDYEMLQKLYEDLQHDCTNTIQTLTGRQFNYMKDIAMGEH